jgi:hypothetical protein
MSGEGSGGVLLIVTLLMAPMPDIGVGAASWNAVATAAGFENGVGGPLSDMPLCEDMPETPDPKLIGVGAAPCREMPPDELASPKSRRIVIDGIDMRNPLDGCVARLGPVAMAVPEAKDGDWATSVQFRYSV